GAGGHSAALQPRSALELVVAVHLHLDARWTGAERAAVARAGARSATRTLISRLRGTALLDRIGSDTIGHFGRSTEQCSNHGGDEQLRSTHESYPSTARLPVTRQDPRECGPLLP